MAQTHTKQLLSWEEDYYRVVFGWDSSVSTAALGAHSVAGMQDGTYNLKLLSRKY